MYSQTSLDYLSFDLSCNNYQCPHANMVLELCNVESEEYTFWCLYYDRLTVRTDVNLCSARRGRIRTGMSVISLAWPADVHHRPIHGSRATPRSFTQDNIFSQVSLIFSKLMISLKFTGELFSYFVFYLYN